MSALVKEISNQKTNTDSCAISMSDQTIDYRFEIPRKCDMLLSINRDPLKMIRMSYN